MYEYSVTQWVFFFYCYCFFGWCFESTYVSCRTRKLTNRGFMRGPFLPLYGSGAIMMLVVSMPFQDSIPFTYLAGCVGATVLEYVTGVCMEALFRVRYWDYSREKLNFQGYICLKSTLAWGGLTILMTSVVHRYVEMVVFLIPTQVLSAVTFLLTAVIFADFSLSFRAALDLRDVLLKLENAKIELAHLQMRMDVLIALTADEWERKLQSLSDLKEEFGVSVEGMELGSIREKIRGSLMNAKSDLQRRRGEAIEDMKVRLRKTLQSYPTMRSKLHGEVLEEVKKYVFTSDHDPK